MLPLVSNAKRNLIAGVTALSVMATGATPALAWGKNEQKFLAGVAATLLVQEIIRDIKRNQRPIYQQQPVYQAPIRYEPVNIYATPTGQAFNTYTDNEQRRIQSTLSAYGYYQGAIDGSFGPGTYNAIVAYAQRTGKTAQLTSRAGAFGVLDGLLF